jgi:hypothetical protein
VTEMPYLRMRGEPLWIELEHFVGCVRDRTEPLVTGIHGRNVLKAAQDILSANLVVS